MFKIEKNVPLASSGNRGAYPFAGLDVGDSFAVPIELWNSVRVLANTNGKALGRKFTVRRDGAQVRVWRLS